jgi:hypothetical protein
MSVETMSSGPAISAATSAAVGPAISSGLSQDIGGTHVSGFDNAAFVQTFEMPAPPSSSFGSDRVNPGFSPFEDTQPLWQVPTENKTEIINNLVEKQAPDIHNTFEGTVELKSPIVGNFDRTVLNELLADTVSIWQAPKEIGITSPAEISIEKPLDNIEIKMPADQAKNLEVIIDETIPDINEAKIELAEDILNAYLAKELPAASPETEMREFVKPESVEMQGLKADALQAVKVKEVLVSMGETDEEAEKYAVEAFAKAQEQKETVKVLKEENNNQSPLPEKPKYEHDGKADNKRKEYIQKAVEAVAKNVDEGQEDKITGEAVVREMPAGQPEEIVSEILPKNSIDESYVQLMVMLREINKFTAETVADEAENLINANHAVKTGATQQATESEVQKVLKGKETVIFKAQSRQ